MDTSQEALFQIMRFNILNSERHGGDAWFLSRAYIYAWQVGVYPAYMLSKSLHEPFRAMFKVSEAEVEELCDFLEKRRSEGTPFTFNDLEVGYGGTRGSTGKIATWPRWKLVITCRYLFLMRQFDSAFWSTLTEEGKCPEQATIITVPFEKKDIDPS